MINEKIVSELVGLVGAYQNNGKTENTDAVVMKALLGCFSDEDTENIVAIIRREKYRISPSCETCPTPCGNTSEYDMQKYHENEALKPIKDELLYETVTFVKRMNASGKSDLPEMVYQAIAFFGYELAEDSYRDLMKSFKNARGVLEHKGE